MVAMPAGPDDGKPAIEDDEIAREALERWKAVQEWQGAQDQRAREDIKFANADARNAWQWPEKTYAQRTEAGTDLPCITINSTRVHNDIIINSLSKNRYAIKVRPSGGKASYKSAEMMETLIRRTQNISRFSSVLRRVTEQQVDGGIGYVLIDTAYISERSFDQDIFLSASRDPTGVYLDPWIKSPDGLDANFGFVFERLPRKEFNRKYPDWKNKVGASPLDTFFSDWMSDKEIVVAKYYRKRQVKDTLVSFKLESGDEIEKLASEIKKESGKEIYDALMDQIKDGTLDGKSRKVTNDEVEWFLIAGNKIVDRGDWAGKYIPILRDVGRELVIDGTLDRKGHTRPLIDAQRMLNWNASMAVQYAASSSKSQWLAPARALEGQEQWKTANVDNFAALTYNDVDDEASGDLQRVDAPQRIAPPAASPAAQQGMQDAERQMMMISGQFQAQMGENDTQSAASGKAIGERQQQGDTATYHFPEHQADMLRALGIQLLDLYPKIYDTKRALHVIGADGEKFWISIDPDQADVVMESQEEQEEEEALRLSFNPKLGQYECVSDPGPDFATQRQEAWNALTMVLTQNHELVAVIGDLLFKYGDFPGADKIMERLQKEIKATKPYLFDENVEPQMVALQEQAKRLVALNTELVQKLAEKGLALRGRDEKRDIEAHHAETDRLKITLDFLTKTMLSEKDKAQLEHELMMGAHDASMQMIIDQNQAELQPAAASNGSAQ